MPALRSLLALLLVAPPLGDCWYASSVSGSGDGRPAMRQMDQASAATTPDQARALVSNQTWITRQASGRNVHYSTVDGRDFLWLPGDAHIVAGEWRVGTETDGQGRLVTALCLRYPGLTRHPIGALAGDQWYCPPIGMTLHDVTDRKIGDVLGLAGRTQAPFVRGYEVATIGQLQARITR